jgi:hypothetical protein
LILACKVNENFPFSEEKAELFPPMRLKSERRGAELKRLSFAEATI